LTAADRIRGVETALELRLGLRDRVAGRSVRGEDEDLLVRVPVVPVAVGPCRVDDRAQLLARDGDVAAGIDDGLAVSGLRARAVAAPALVRDRLVAGRRRRDAAVEEDGAGDCERPGR